VLIQVISSATDAKPATAVALDLSPDRSVVGQAVTITAKVTAVDPTAGTPTGTVTFVAGDRLSGGGRTTTLAVLPLDANGTATLTTSALGLGDRVITATYNGSTVFGPASASRTETVRPADTAVALTSSPNPAAIGTPVTFTAIVTAVPPGSGTPTGIVRFLSDGKTIGAVPTDANGVATLTTSTLGGSGSHAITARYSGASSSGDGRREGPLDPYNGSTSGVLIQVIS